MLSRRERPKFQPKDDTVTPRSGVKPLGEASGTVKVTRDSGIDDTVRVRFVESLDSAYCFCFLNFLA